MVARGFLPPLDTPGLTKRELEILTLARGHSNTAIPGQVGISPNTVRNILTMARGKYDLRAAEIDPQEFDPRRPAAAKSIP